MAAIQSTLVNFLLFWLQVTAILASGFPKLLDATVEDLAAGLQSGAFSSVDLVNAYTARILEVNDTLHAVTELNPDAVAIARALDAERKSGTNRGPLHGIPILIKNNIATADKMNNTAGSYALLGAKVPRDAQVARKLREAGVVILGKTGLSQWANYRSSYNSSSNGWSAYGGQVVGAFYSNQDPSGSSSGSGVASSVGLALACLGTETDGSIVSPSDVNNLVGIKPTVGLTSRNLVIPISEHQDTVGPMARTVADAAYILTAIAGEDPYDNYTSAIPNKNKHIDYTKALDPNALQGKRIGVVRNLQDLFAGTDTIVNASSSYNLVAFNAALKVLQDAGATVIEGTNFTALNQFVNSTSETKGLNADFLVNLKQYTASLVYNPNNVSTLEDVRRFTQSFPLEDYPDRDTAVWDDALSQGFDNTSPEFVAVREENLQIGGPGGILGILEKYNLDAAVVLTGYSSSFPALVGSPIVTVPLGFYPEGTKVVESTRNLVSTAPGIPFGLAFMGAKWSEETLIGLAYAYEQKTQVQKQGKPIVVPKTELSDVVGRQSRPKL